MKVENYHPVRSSFLSLEKDLGLFTDLMLKNKNLKKLLYYTTRDAMNRPALSNDESIGLFGNNIKIVPKVYVDGSVLNYIIISFDNFTPNVENPQFRDNVVSFDIICHFDQWQLQDFQLRPYRIAAELDTMFNNKHFTGIGTLQFLGANQIILNDEFAGITLMYSAIHGGEDQIRMQNPSNEEQHIQDWKELQKLIKMGN